MAKKTKRKNNKLSKRKYSRRKYSRRRLSRKRVTKKNLSRRRIYQEKYRQSGGADSWKTKLLDQIVQRNIDSSVVAEQYPQTEVGPIKVFIFSDIKGNPKHFYEPAQQIQLTSVYGKSNHRTGTIKIKHDGCIYNVTIDKNEEYNGERVYPMDNGEWCKVTHEIGTQKQVEDETKTRKVFVGIKYGLYPGDLCVVEEYSIIKNKLTGFNSKTNLVFAATSKGHEPEYVYFINDGLKSDHVVSSGKLLILKNPPKKPEEYKGRTKETQNVDGSTPSEPSLSGWRVKHWQPIGNDPPNNKCPYGGGITERISWGGGVDYETPNGIILLFSPEWPEGKLDTESSRAISFDGLPKIEPIKIILRNDPALSTPAQLKEKFNKLFEQLSIMTKHCISSIQRFPQPIGAHIVVSRGSVIHFGAGKSWSPIDVAIVNAANNGGLRGAGVDGAITAAGGINLANDRLKLPLLDKIRKIRIQTGDAVLTGPGNYGDLHVANVIHAVGPNYTHISEQDGNSLLQKAYENSMKVAEQNNIKYIGFSLLSSGIFRGDPARISLDEVLRIGIDTVKANMYKGLLEVHFVAFTETEKEALLRHIETTSGSGPGLGPNLEPEPEQESFKIIHIGNSGEIIKQIMDQKYSFDEPIYKDDKELILIKGLFSQETGFILSAQLKEHGTESVISIQVAGNPLLPGGKYQLTTRDGTLDLEQIDIIPKHHTTQEESVIDSLLHAEFIKNGKEKLPGYFENMIGKEANLTPLVGQRIKHRIYPPEAAVLIQLQGGRDTPPAINGRPWGCLNPDVNPDGGVDNTMSIQGVDFTEAIPESDDRLMEYALKYNFAYTLDDVDMALSANYYLRNGVDKTSDGTFETDVVFCYGPNAYAESDEKNPSGTMTRSKIKDYIEDDHHRTYFRECVKMSYRATLTSMKDNRVDYPILCYVSGGIYSGQREKKLTNIFIRKQIPIIIDEINNELGKPFNNIFLCG